MLETVYHAYVGTSDPVARKHLAAALRRLTYLETQKDLPKGYTSPKGLTQKEIEVGRYEGKIPCIKLVRDRTNFGLKETKDLVEKYFYNHGFAFKGYNVAGTPIYAPF